MKRIGSSQFSVWQRLLATAVLAMAVAVNVCGQQKQETMNVCLPGGGVVSFPLSDIDSVVYNNVAGLLKCPDDKHPHAIDLGLRSGTKWACCNVGASKPEDMGNYYAWGEYEPKSSYIWNNYIFVTQLETDNSAAQCSDVGTDIAGTTWDAAFRNWGGMWTMPTREQVEEMIQACGFEERTSSVKGYDAVSYNGGRIFFPMGGCMSGDKVVADTFGYYWTSTLRIPGEDDKRDDGNRMAYTISVREGMRISSDFRKLGLLIRPVLAPLKIAKLKIGVK